jgi:hypothetical protein
MHFALLSYAALRLSVMFSSNLLFFDVILFCAIKHFSTMTVVNCKVMYVVQVLSHAALYLYLYLYLYCYSGEGGRDPLPITGSLRRPLSGVLKTFALKSLSYRSPTGKRNPEPNLTLDYFTNSLSSLLT